MSSSLDLLQSARELVTELELSEGVTDEDLDARLVEFIDGSGEKLDAHRYVIDQFKSQADIMRANARRLGARAKMLENVIDRIKIHAVFVMEGRIELLGEDDGRRLETEHGIVYLRTTKKLQIFNEDSFIEYAKAHSDTQDLVKYTPKIDKREVMKKLKGGDMLGGEAVIEDTRSVVFK